MAGNGLIVGDALLAAGTIGAAVIATIGAVRAGKAREVGHENRDSLTETRATLQRIEQNTDGRLDEKIKSAVEQVARERPGLLGSAVYHEALRDLLDAFIGASLTEEDEDDDGPGPRRRLHLRRPDRHDED